MRLTRTEVCSETIGCEGDASSGVRGCVIGSLLQEFSPHMQMALKHTFTPVAPGFRKPEPPRRPRPHGDAIGSTAGKLRGKTHLWWKWLFSMNLRGIGVMECHKRRRQVSGYSSEVGAQGVCRSPHRYAAFNDCCVTSVCTLIAEQSALAHFPNLYQHCPRLDQNIHLIWTVYEHW